MNEAKNIKDFMTRLMKVVNQIKLLAEKFLYSRIVEKVFVLLAEKFEPTSFEKASKFEQWTH